MQKEPQRIQFDYFTLNLQRVFDDMARAKKKVLVERQGQLYRIEPEEEPPGDIWGTYDPQKVKAGLRKSAGALKGVDREQLLADLREGREQDLNGRPF